MKINVILEIDYDSETVQDEAELIQNLQQNVQDAIGNGLLTGPLHEVEVDDWNISFGPL